jgi:hypothetical protein
MPLSLVDGGLRPRPTDGGGWHWQIVINTFLVKVDFLCDVPGDEHNHAVPLPGCSEASAWNVEGPRAALVDSVTHELVVPQELGGGHFLVFVVAVVFGLVVFGLVPVLVGVQVEVVVAVDVAVSSL